MELVIVVAGLFVCLAAIVGVTYASIRFGEHVRERWGRRGFAIYLTALTLLLICFVTVLIWVLIANGLAPVSA